MSIHVVDKIDMQGVFLIHLLTGTFWAEPVKLKNTL